MSKNMCNRFGFKWGVLAAVLLLAGGIWAGVTDTPVAPDAQNEAPDVTSVPQVGQDTRIEALALDLVWVAPGAFRMGTPGGEYADELPARTVQISRGSWMGRTEVTQAQWRALMGDNPSYFEGDDLPVERVSWHQSVEFCRRLTELERQAGRLPEGYAYRLPTEAEWEYAARGGADGRDTRRAGSDDIDAVAWYKGNSQSRTHPVGMKAPNELGLHDMNGNVWEWVHDWYQNSYDELAETDPVGPATGILRVIRGGSWYSTPAYCRVAHRVRFAPFNTFLILGFRVVLAPELQDAAED